MELPLLPFLFFSLSGVIVFFLFSSFSHSKLPPGPPAAPIIGNLFWFRRSFNLQHLDSLLHDLRARYGPIVTLRIGSVPVIFVTDASLAHKALIEHGATFSGRPTPLPAARFLSSNQHIISAASYGPIWRLLRRNLVSETLHPSRISLFEDGRRWAFDLLSQRLRAQSETGDGIVVPRDSFQYAMFCLVVLMCFGEKFDEKVIREIEIAQRNYLLHAGKLTFLLFVPAIAGYFFRKKLGIAMELRRKQKEVFAPLIKARRERRKEITEGDGKPVFSYVDSLLEIQLPEDGGRFLNEDELVALCSEFLSAGTDTTATSLQWIMAELVKNQQIQLELWEEIKNWEGSSEDLQKLPFLNAVIMEGLRLHPPGHLLLPHAVTEDIKFEGYLIPKNSSINFSIAEMALDEKIWKEAMEFKPERFMEGGSAARMDITGNREIKMMPFGAGRRICPGLGLAIFHLEFFAANLVREFEWRNVEGEEIDLSEKTEFTVVMKNSLRARLVPRKRIRAM
ncbi:cytochrome P450 89A2-like [Phalaenopsis equestris]|uniref:cytochrome P450 89A2-like n=1 Tax=Phalaenopsis equestris TaxID=78828 RepID=UPI0009E469A3|nr:cytochrome P450 89A2-like [Phalaenopsis equestris]